MTKSTKFSVVKFILVIVLGSPLSGCNCLSQGSPGEFSLVISGIVTDVETGKPVEGARVADHLYCGSTKRPCQEAWTDKEGRYELKTWYEEHSLVVSAPGYPPKLLTLMTKIFTHEPEMEMNISMSKERQ